MCVYIYIHTYAAVEVMPTENLKDKDSSPYLPHSTHPLWLPFGQT